jgi:mycothiol synthase
LQLSRRTDHVETWSPPYVPPILAAMPEIGVFPAESDAELQGSIDLYNAVHPHDPASLSEARETERQARDFAVFQAELDGTLAGAAHVLLPTYTDVPLGHVYVLAEHRGRGVGQALYETVSRWAADHEATALGAHVQDDDAGSLAWAKERGFQERSREPFVELDLETFEPRPVEPPDGVEIVTWAERPELARGIYEVACEAWPDIPGSEDETIEPFDLWLSVHMQGSGDRQEATFVAVADGEAVGYAKLSFWDAKPDTPFHDLTGVKRAWRGHGVARALKHTQLNWAKEQGYRYLRTGNEERNEPIRRLNEQLGYKPIPGRIKLEGPIAG